MEFEQPLLRIKGFSLETQAFGYKNEKCFSKTYLN